jgi:hypothetical protein
VLRDRIAKFTEAPAVRLGTPAGPGPHIAIGWPAKFLGMGEPSKAIKPTVDIERHWPDVRFRMWFADVGGRVWFSLGFYTMPIHRYLVLKARARWRRWREPVPRAQVVHR